MQGRSVERHRSSHPNISAGTAEDLWSAMEPTAFSPIVFPILNRIDVRVVIGAVDMGRIGVGQSPRPREKGGEAIPPTRSCGLWSVPKWWALGMGWGEVGKTLGVVKMWRKKGPLDIGGDPGEAPKSPPVTPCADQSYPHSSTVLHTFPTVIHKNRPARGWPVEISVELWKSRQGRSMIVKTFADGEQFAA